MISPLSRCLAVGLVLCAGVLFSTELAVQQPPSKVVVVNTQDASVSVVDHRSRRPRPTSTPWM